MPAPQITKSDVSDTETLAVSTKSRDRDAFQKEMDAEIKALVGQWLAAEKVSEVPEEGKAKVKVGARPKARYHVSPEDKTPFKDVLRWAGFGQAGSLTPALRTDTPRSTDRGVFQL